MSLRKAVHLPSVCLSESRPTSLFPFLYQTRTLLSVQSSRSPPTAQLRDDRGRRPFCSSEVPRASYKPLAGTHDERRHDEFRPKRSPVRRSQGPQRSLGIPEERLQWPAGFPRRSEAQEEKGRTSTITTSEKAVFDRIFSDISKSAPADEEDDFQENLEYDAMDRKYSFADPRDQLSAIFETVIKEADKYSKSDSESHDSFASGNYRKAIGLDRTSIEQLGLSEVETEESEAFLKQACNDHKQLVCGMLDSAETDIDIWAVLEKEVFSLVVQLNLQMKLEEKARKADLRRQKIATRAKSKLGETIEKRRSAATNTTLATLANSESKALTINALLSILQTNYSLYCLHALRLFRHRGLSSPYALHMLPHIKSLGSISYVLGASTGLYDEILYQKWTQFNDVQGIADLMEEMVNQGIGASFATLELLRFVDWSRQRDLGGRDGSAKRTWWKLRPVKDGWKRVKALYERFKMDLVNTAEETARREEMGLEEEAEMRAAGIAEDQGVEVVPRIREVKAPLIREVRSPLIVRRERMTGETRIQPKGRSGGSGLSNW